MNNKATMDFSVDKENKTVTVKREFAAPLPLIWDAYTKSEILDKWWAPKPWKARTKSMDFSPGGKWLYAMIGPEGQEMWSMANYKEIEFQKRYTGLDVFADAEGNVNKEMPQSKWEVTFADKGESTLVQTKMQFNDLAQLEDILKMGFKEGYDTAMGGLDELLPSLEKNKINHKTMNVKSIYLNLPIKDLNKTKDFWTKLGFSFNPKFSNDKALCMVLNEGSIYVMLLTHEFFSTFTNRPIADGSTTEVLTAIPVESREKVDEIMKLALANGGTRYRDVQDFEWMYNDAFADLDGHQWEVFYMDESKLPQ